jgi:hypothetical protein
VNEQLLAFIGEPVLDAMQRVIAHMFYLPGKVIDTIERKVSVEKPTLLLLLEISTRQLGLCLKRRVYYLRPVRNSGPLFIGILSSDSDFVTLIFTCLVKISKKTEIRGFSFSELCTLFY